MKQGLSLLLWSACLSFCYSYSGDLIQLGNKTGLIVGGDNCRYPWCGHNKKKLGLTQATNGSHSISGLDCRYPRSVKNGLLKHICQRDPEEPEEEMKGIILLQYSNLQNTRAVRCRRRETRLNAVCGAFSHTKILEPPDVLISAMITVEECQRAVHQGIFNEESGRSTPVKKNNRYHYKYLEHGTLTSSTDNVACTGGEIYVHGEIHRSIITMVTVELEFTELNLKLYPNGTYESFKCNKDLCQDGLISYVLLKEVNYCPLYIIRTLLMRPVHVQTEEGNQQAWVSHEHKMLLIERGQEVAPPGCNPITTVISTNFKSLKIVLVLTEDKLAELRNVAHTLGASEVDLDLELRMSAEYLTYYTEQQLKNTVLHMGSNLCMMSQHSLHTAELSPFHKNSLLRIRGEIVSELECNPVQVVIRIGDQRGFCTTDTIPGWLDNEPVHVQAGTHLVVEESQINQVACNQRYTAIFRTDNGVLLQANPVVTEIQMIVSHIESEYAHLLPKENVHHGDSEDLLYTNEEVEEFNQMVHFSRTKDRVLDALVIKYCENGNCGNYKPSAQSSYFNLEQLKDTIEHPFAWIGNLRRSIAEVGSYCSLLILIFVFIKFLIYIYQLLNLKLRTQTDAYDLEMSNMYTQNREEETHKVRNVNFVASAPALPVDELQTLMEGGRSAPTPPLNRPKSRKTIVSNLTRPKSRKTTVSNLTPTSPVARPRNMKPEYAEIGEKVKEADSQQDVVVESEPPHPRNWLEEL